MKRVLIPGVILCGADVAQAVDDKNMYMHFFEEMTVYAPVPVPVNGNTHYTSESIERLPTGNGNISDTLVRVICIFMLAVDLREVVVFICKPAIKVVIC